jgi:hypothetical protein
MGTELQIRFSALIEEAHQIRSNPVRVARHAGAPSFGVTHEEHLDHCRVLSWIHKAAKLMNATFLQGNPIRVDWDYALKRVESLHEADHLPRLQAILTEVAKHPSATSHEAVCPPALKDDELADLLLRDLYETRNEDGGNITMMALSHGVDNSKQVQRVGTLLNELGFLKDFHLTSADVGGWISPKAVSLIERLGKGQSIMDHRHQSDQKVQPSNITIGNVSNSPFNIQSNQVDQATKIETGKSLIEWVVDIFKKIGKLFGY